MKIITKKFVSYLLFYVMTSLPLATMIFLFTCFYLYIKRDVYTPSIIQNTSVTYNSSRKYSELISININSDVNCNNSGIYPWYEEKGYTCDGDCENTIHIPIIGDYYIYIYKHMIPKVKKVDGYTIEVFLHIEIAIDK
jgi:hypothetical protein